MDEEKPDPKSENITSTAPVIPLKRGLFPLAIWLFGSLTVGFILGFAVAITSGDTSREGLGIAGIIAAVMAGGAASYWAWSDIRAGGAGYKRQLGWSSPKYTIFQVLILCSTIFMLERLLQVGYQTLQDWLGGWNPVEQGVVTALSNAGDGIGWYFSILASIVLLPIFEEIIFRGHLQTALVARFGVAPGIILASLVFSLLHFDVSYIVPLFLLGASFGIVRHACASLWPAIVLHVVNNAVAIVLLYAAPSTPA